MVLDFTVALDVPWSCRICLLWRICTPPQRGNHSFSFSSDAISISQKSPRNIMPI